MIRISTFTCSYKEVSHFDKSNFVCIDAILGRAGLIANTTCLSLPTIGIVLVELIDMASDAWLPVGEVGVCGTDSSPFSMQNKKQKFPHIINLGRIVHKISRLLFFYQPKRSVLLHVVDSWLAPRKLHVTMLGSDSTNVNLLHPLYLNCIERHLPPVGLHGCKVCICIVFFF